jgi:hypothetical protein
MPLNTRLPRICRPTRSDNLEMMFLQFAIWGAWATVIGNYLKYLKFDESVVGWVGSLMPFAARNAAMSITGNITERIAEQQAANGCRWHASSGRAPFTNGSNGGRANERQGHAMYPRSAARRG